MLAKKYLVIEDEVNVAEGIVLRMKAYSNWQYMGNTATVAFSIEQIELHKPSFIFLDWKLKGGSGYEVLDYLLSKKNYQPFILFMTAQVEEENRLLKEIIAKYKNVDQFISKPIWMHLTNHLNAFIEAAEYKISINFKKTKWLHNISNTLIEVDLNLLTCIVQHHTKRAKDFYFFNSLHPITFSLSWTECYALLNEYEVNYFISNKRTHLVTKKYILSFNKPYVKIKNFDIFKIEVVKESICDFENWLRKM